MTVCKMSRVLETETTVGRRHVEQQSVLVASGSTTGKTVPDGVYSQKFDPDDPHWMFQVLLFRLVSIKTYR